MMIVQRTRRVQVCSMALLLLAACGDGDDPPDRPIGGPGMMDAGSWDAGPLDARVAEAGESDATVPGTE